MILSNPLFAYLQAFSPRSEVTLLPLLPLLKGRKISLDDALDKDSNMLDELKWSEEMLECCYHRYVDLPQIGNVVLHPTPADAR